MVEKERKEQTISPSNSRKIAKLRRGVSSTGEDDLAARHYVDRTTVELRL